MPSEETRNCALCVQTVSRLLILTIIVLCVSLTQERGKMNVSDVGWGRKQGTAWVVPLIHSHDF